MLEFLLLHLSNQAIVLVVCSISFIVLNRHRIFIFIILVALLLDDVFVVFQKLSLFLSVFSSTLDHIPQNCIQGFRSRFSFIQVVLSHYYHFIEHVHSTYDKVRTLFLLNVRFQSSVVVVHVFHESEKHEFGIDKLEVLLTEQFLYLADEADRVAEY